MNKIFKSFFNLFKDFLTAFICYSYYGGTFLGVSPPIIA